MPSLPGAHAWVHSLAHESSEDPSIAVDEPIPSNYSSSSSSSSHKWCAQKQNRGFGGSSLKRGRAVDAMLSDSSSKLHAVFKKALAKHNLEIQEWQTCVDVPSSAPSIFHGFSPILDCLCTDKSLALVPVEVKASRPRKLKRRSAKDVGMKPPFCSFADTFCLRHQLQLCLQNAALGNRKPTGFLAYVDVANEEIKLVKMNKAIWALAQAGG